MTIELSMNGTKDMNVDLPAGVNGSADHRFQSAVSTFAAIFGRRHDSGGALTVYEHGRKVLDIRAGYADDNGRAWDADTGTIVFSASKAVAATVIHRLVDQGILDYDVPIAEYWPEFGRAGKHAITVGHMLSHRAGLSTLRSVARSVDEFLDHRLMEERLAAASPDSFLGRPIYHAFTQGWALAGLARAVTGHGMAHLIRREIAEPLGVEGMHLGRPPADSPTTVAAIAGDRIQIVGHPVIRRMATAAANPGGTSLALARAIYLPGIEEIFAGDHPRILDTEMPAGNVVCTADALAKMLAPLANGGMIDGERYLSPGAVRAIRKVESFRLDRAVTIPFWHLGYHTILSPFARPGFGHIGHGGSCVWADPRSGISIGFVHNRMTTTRLAADQTLMIRRVVPSVMRGVR